MDEALIRSVALGAAIAPAFVIALYFLVAARGHVGDRLIWTCFGFGACAAFPAIVAAQVYEVLIGYGEGLFAVSAKQALFGAAVPEEISKLVALLCLFEWRRRALRPTQTFTLAVVVACGFAAFENVFYVVESDHWHFVAITRSVSAVPGHAFDGAVMGYCLIQAYRRKAAVFWWCLALVLPIVLHAAYDFSPIALENLTDDFSGGQRDLVPLLVNGFIATVILEGLAAHLCLRSVLALPETRTNGDTADGAGMAARMGRWVQIASTHPFSWLALSGLCLVAAGALVLETPAGSTFGISIDRASQTAMERGIAIFAALHGVAFAGLASVVWRRA